MIRDKDTVLGSSVDGRLTLSAHEIDSKRKTLLYNCKEIYNIYICTLLQYIPRTCTYVQGIYYPVSEIRCIFEK